MNKATSKKKNIQWWQCPECGWDPSDITDMDAPELFYYIEDGIVKPIKDGWKEVFDKKGNSISWEFNLEIFKEIMKTKNTGIYPKRTNGSYCYDHWSGATGSSWKEIHKCPNCNKEFDFSNSTI